MNIKQLEHILRACGSIAGCREIIVIGSQALLASHPDAPEELLRSVEVDCYPLDDPAKADLIDGSIGELSPFHETFGYYAHGGRNAFDVTTFHHSNGIHDQVRSGPGHPPRSSSGFFPPERSRPA
jgi:hypothetical protein